MLPCNRVCALKTYTLVTIITGIMSRLVWRSGQEQLLDLQPNKFRLASYSSLEIFICFFTFTRIDCHWGSHMCNTCKYPVLVSKHIRRHTWSNILHESCSFAIITLTSHITFNGRAAAWMSADLFHNNIDCVFITLRILHYGGANKCAIAMTTCAALWHNLGLRV